jgi:hypothetical protein
MIRLISFLLLTVFSLSVPWYFSFAAMVVYAFFYEGIELIVLGFLLDSYMGYAIPRLHIGAVYTIAVTGILIFFWGLRPLLFIKRDEQLL